MEDLSSPPQHMLSTSIDITIDNRDHDDDKNNNIESSRMNQLEEQIQQQLNEEIQQEPSTVKNFDSIETWKIQLNFRIVVFPGKPRSSSSNDDDNDNNRQILMTQIQKVVDWVMLHSGGQNNNCPNLHRLVVNCNAQYEWLGTSDTNNDDDDPIDYFWDLSWLGYRDSIEYGLKPVLQSFATTTTTTNDAATAYAVFTATSTERSSSDEQHNTDDDGDSDNNNNNKTTNDDGTHDDDGNVAEKGEVGTTTTITTLGTKITDLTVNYNIDTSMLNWFRRFPLQNTKVTANVVTMDLPVLFPNLTTLQVNVWGRLLRQRRLDPPKYVDYFLDRWSYQNIDTYWPIRPKFTFCDLPIWEGGGPP